VLDGLVRQPRQGAAPLLSKSGQRRLIASQPRIDLPPMRTALALHSKSRLHAERLLTSLFIDCLEEAIPKEAIPVQGISHAQVRRAEQWIEGHLKDVIGIDKLGKTLRGVRSWEDNPRSSSEAPPITLASIVSNEMSGGGAGDDAIARILFVTRTSLVRGLHHAGLLQHFPSGVLAMLLGIEDAPAILEGRGYLGAQ